MADIEKFGKSECLDFQGKITFCLKGRKKDIFGSKNAKVKKFHKIFSLDFSEFFLMTGLLGCIIPCTWVKARLQLLIQLHFEN